MKSSPPEKIPNWDDYLLAQALLVSQRSPDKQTKCGCVIVNSLNQIIGQGYNGFPRGLSDQELPNVRPEKYPWMIHAVVNAVLNCCERQTSAKAYITTKPCFNCTLLMWQAGVREIVYAGDWSSPVMVDEDEEYWNLMSKFISMSNMSIRAKTNVDLSFLKNLENF